MTMRSGREKSLQIPAGLFIHMLKVLSHRLLKSFITHSVSYQVSFVNNSVFWTQYCTYLVCIFSCSFIKK